MRLDGARPQRTLGCTVQPTALTTRRADLASPFRIGEVEIASRVVLAPMAGVSVQAFRRQGRRFGAGLVCSEMVSACGLSHGNARTLGYLRIARDEHPLAVQVFGSEPATVAEAARMCEAAGADIIDINFGCPVRKVTKTGAGASALDNHDVAIAVTRAVAEAVARARDREAARRRAQRLARLPRARPQAGRRGRPGDHAAPALGPADVHGPRRPRPDGRARRPRRRPRHGIGRHHRPRAAPRTCSTRRARAP